MGGGGVEKTEISKVSGVKDWNSKGMHSDRFWKKYTGHASLKFENFKGEVGY